jgi:hypothetical protein
MKNKKKLIKYSLYTLSGLVLAITCLLYPDKAEIVARALLLFCTGL